MNQHAIIKHKSYGEKEKIQKNYCKRIPQDENIVDLGKITQKTCKPLAIASSSAFVGSILEVSTLSLSESNSVSP